MVEATELHAVKGMPKCQKSRRRRQLPIAGHEPRRRAVEPQGRPSQKALAPSWQRRYPNSRDFGYEGQASGICYFLSILRMRRRWRPPSKGVAIHTFTIVSAKLRDMVRSPRERTLASL